MSAAGDVNGDGLADVIIGAPYTRAGESYVVFGTPSVDPSFDLSTLDGTDGFAINGADPAAISSIEASAAGDANGDGLDDLLISFYDTGGGLGPVAVVFGGVDVGAGAEVDVSTLGSGDGLVLKGIDGTNGADTLIGSTAAEAIAGGLGNDILVRGGGLDVLRGGEGDDIIVIADAGFLRVDGGAEASGGNADTLRLADGDLDLTTVADTRIEGIEAIDLSASGSGANALSLQLADVLNISETSNELVIAGGTGEGETVNVGDGTWTNQGSSSGFTQYTAGAATLLIDDDISVTISLAA